MDARVPIVACAGLPRPAAHNLCRATAALGIPTRLNTTPADIPVDQEDLDGDGIVTLDLSTSPLGGVLNFHLDTLHADYAFIISPEPLVKRRSGNPVGTLATDIPTTWDFTLYPNPAREEAWLHFENDNPKDIQVVDAMGRLLRTYNSVTSIDLHLDLHHVASGLVSIRVNEGTHVGHKKLLIQ
ncbi:MAG: T9SS type A sorting domain-containing protein [Flavobacteriales bacterium]